MAERSRFLATPKGVFLMGLIVGAMSTLSFGFMLVADGSLTFGRAVPAGPAAITPPAFAEAPAGKPLVITPRTITKDDHVIGTGPISVIEYADYECPFCREFHRTMQEIMANNQGKVRWVFRHLPLTSVHPDAEPAAEAAECAGDQGKFWQMTDIIYTHQDEGLTSAKLKDFAALAGVKNIKAWTACVTARTHADRIRSDAEDAAAIGAEGTPYGVITNDKGISQEVPGALPISNIQAIIDALSK